MCVCACVSEGGQRVTGLMCVSSAWESVWEVGSLCQCKAYQLSSTPPPPLTLITAT